MEEIRPKLKGLIHYIAFITTCILTSIYLLFCLFTQWCHGIAIYLFSQLILFGISSKYHRTKWASERKRRLFQKLDHASIFLLISGTQTGVSLAILPAISAVRDFLVTTWVISILGIIKVLLLTNIYETFDVVFYIIHGISVFPFAHLVVQYLSAVQIICFILGGVCYICGGILFRLRRPDPSPRIFGYHEVFHVFTVVANGFYMIPILTKYLSMVFDGNLRK